MQMYYSFNQLIDTWNKHSGIAILYGDDRKSLSYNEFAQLIRKQEKEIRSLSIRSEFIITDHNIETLVRIFADVLAGCDIVLADEATPDESLYRLAGLIGTDSTYASDKELAKELAQQSSACTHTFLNGSPEKEGRLLFFTSGTTGSSKAVVLTSGSLLASSWSGQSMLPCGPGDVLLSLLPFSHVFGFVCTMLWGLSYGATIALGRGMRGLFSDCDLFKPTILPAVPSLLKMLMSRNCLGDSLRIALIGAAPLDRKTVKELQDKGIKVYLGYGLTETSSGLAITQDQNDPHALYPCPGADIRIEPDGEISVKTPAMMEGYLDFTTGEAIPVTDGRLYTGDLGSMDEKGILRLTGRKKDMLVLQDGTKIFCPEYEAELAALLGTDEAAVILHKEKPAVILGFAENEASEKVRNIIEKFNEKKARSVRIYDILYFGRPLPRTVTGKIRRWDIIGR